jgi:di-N-acetylchitobiase
MAAASLLVAAALLALGCAPAAAATSCPCDDPSLCEPIKGTPKKEIFGFVTSESNWPGYNWTLLTTVALFTKTNDSLLCHAHSKGVRVVLSASYDTSQLQDSAKIKEWIQEHLEAVQSGFADGLNIDIEGEVAAGSGEVGLLTQLVKDTVAAFKTANRDYQVTFDVAWSPRCIDGRCYDYAAVAAAVDFLVVMAYDERSQIFGSCTASANSGFGQTISGVEGYLSFGVPKDSLVLGLPWYGYDYPCLSLTEDLVCTIPEVPYRGVNCSDAAGTQRSYTGIRDFLRTATTFVRWNASLEAPYFNYKSQGGERHQVWFDNTESLSLKYIFAGQSGLRGLAFWNLDCLEYNGSQHDDFLTQEMWEAILVFFEV